MKKFLATIFVFLTAVCAVTVSSSTEADAQRRNRYTKAQVDNIISRVEQRVDRFVTQFDRSLDNSRLDGTRREDNLNQRARDLEAATDELRREFNRRDRWNENRDEVRRCLNIASDINVAMRNRRLNRATENNWANVRAELNALARVYNLPGVGGAYR
jgi:exonuclease VII large subunit